MKHQFHANLTLRSFSRAFLSCVLLACLSHGYGARHSYAAPLSEAQIDLMKKNTENQVFEALDQLGEVNPKFERLGKAVKLFYGGSFANFGADDMRKIAQASASGGKAAAKKELDKIIEGRIRDAYFEMARAGVKYLTTKVAPQFLKNNPVKMTFIGTVAAAMLEPEDIAVSQGMSPTESKRAFAALDRLQKAQQDRFWDDLIRGETPNATDLPPYLRIPVTGFEGTWRIEESKGGKTMRIVSNAGGYRINGPKFNFDLQRQGNALKGTHVLSMRELEEQYGTSIPAGYQSALMGKVRVHLTITMGDDGGTARYVFDGCNWEVDLKTKKVTITPRPAAQTLTLVRQ